METVSSLEERYDALLRTVSSRAAIRRREPLKHHTTLRVGGAADLFYEATDVDELAHVAAVAHQLDLPTFVLGSGSNILAGDAGVRGLVIFNSCRQCDIGELTYAQCGVSFQELFVRSAAAGLTGLEFAVGIPGTLGGALVSNAGAYRANVCELIERIDLVSAGERQVVGPEWMQFSYRDSRLRRTGAPPTVLLAVWIRVQRGERREILARAREFQRQRNEKQPPQASAGSFFKNVVNAELAERLEGLPEPMRQVGVVPAGYLISACDLKGLKFGGAAVSRKHANFIVNRGGATASDIRSLASHVKQVVNERFGIHLEEEVLYVGDWSGWEEA